MSNVWTCQRFQSSVNNQNRNDGEQHLATLIYTDHSLTVRQFIQEPRDGCISRECSLHADRRCENAMRHIRAIWVPHNLMHEQLQKQIDICHTWKQRLCEDSSFLDHIVITVNETSRYHQDPVENTEWKTSSSPPLKIHQTRSATSVLLCVFFDKYGVIYRHIVPPHMAITVDAYIKIFKILLRHLWNKCPGLARSFILHYDNILSCPIVRIWLLVILGCFQSCRNSWDTVCFPQMKTFSWPATRYSLAF